MKIDVTIPMHAMSAFDSVCRSEIASFAGLETNMYGWHKLRSSRPTPFWFPVSTTYTETSDYNLLLSTHLNHLRAYRCRSFHLTGIPEALELSSFVLSSGL